MYIPHTNPRVEKNNDKFMKFIISDTKTLNNDILWVQVYTIIENVFFYEWPHMRSLGKYDNKKSCIDNNYCIHPNY